jgi:sulfatase modifying factor 1
VFTSIGALLIVVCDARGRFCVKHQTSSQNPITSDLELVNQGGKVTVEPITPADMKLENLLTIAASGMLMATASASVTIDWVTVGNAGNAADPSTGYGAVGYNYQIGKYEVTNAQYGAFLNAKAATDSYGLYHDYMSSYGITRSGSSGSYTYSVTTALANRPVVYVTWFDAARFANWLANGQGTGDTETGSYMLNGVSYGNIAANAGAQVYIPTEDEWYKAAYYNGSTETYSLYPTGQNSITTEDANYDSSVGSSTDVGTYMNDPSYYGTLDQGGNVWEWNDAVTSFTRGLRGGSWYLSEYDLRSTSRPSQIVPSFETSAFVGFRVASAIPEPASTLLSALGAMMLLRRRRN